MYLNQTAGVQQKPPGPKALIGQYSPRLESANTFNPAFIMRVTNTCPANSDPGRQPAHSATAKETSKMSDRAHGYRYSKNSHILIKKT